MLVLTRREQESIEIEVPPSDQPTTIRVLFISREGGKIRLGVDAPHKVHIKRGELVDQPPPAA